MTKLKPIKFRNRGDKPADDHARARELAEAIFAPVKAKKKRPAREARKSSNPPVEE